MWETPLGIITSKMAGFLIKKILPVVGVALQYKHKLSTSPQDTALM